MQGQCVATGSTLNSAICGGDTFYVGPNAHTQAGAYSDTLTNADGCDSVVTLTLIVNHRYNDTLVQNICTGDSFSFAGIWHRTAGYYYDSLVTVNGCDSIIALNLIVNPPVTQTIHDTICTGDTVNFNGHAYTTTGIRRDTLTTVNGCDSIVVLNLIVRPILTSSISRSICRGGNFDFNGRNITAAGTYKDTLTTSLGCDSVVTLTLSYTADIPHYINAAICHGENYVFHGNTLTYSGVYRDTLW